MFLITRLLSGRVRIAVRRFNSLQMPHKKVLKPPSAIGATRAVTAIGDEKKIKIFTGADERIHKTISALRRDVFIHLTDDEHEMSLELACVLDVGAFGILRPDRISHPLLVPRCLVHSIVVATAVGDGGFVELGMKQNRSGSVLAASGSSIDADAGYVVPTVFGPSGFVP